MQDERIEQHPQVVPLPDAVVLLASEPDGQLSRLRELARRHPLAQPVESLDPTRSPAPNRFDDEDVSFDRQKEIRRNPELLTHFVKQDVAAAGAAGNSCQFVAAELAFLDHGFANHPLRLRFGSGRAWKARGLAVFGIDHVSGEEQYAALDLGCRSTVAGARDAQRLGDEREAQTELFKDFDLI